MEATGRDPILELGRTGSLVSRPEGVIGRDDEPDAAERWEEAREADRGASVCNVRGTMGDGMAALDGNGWLVLDATLESRSLPASSA